MDSAMGSLWWLMLIHVILISAVLIVRGRPYTGESIVAVLVKGSGCMANWCNPLLTFSWSVVLPVGLVVIFLLNFLYVFPIFENVNKNNKGHYRLTGQAKMNLMAFFFFFFFFFFL